MLNAESWKSPTGEVFPDGREEAPVPLPKADAHYTYRDYVTWSDDERWELIEGTPYAMTPAPSVKHQQTVGRLFALLDAPLRRHPCTPFIAPTDVVLSEADVVQPDVFVVCDPAKVTPAHIRGDPDLVIEVLSPATALKDRRAKRDLYERHGVREYVLLDPEARYAERLILGSGGRWGSAELFAPEETLRLTSLGGLEIALQDVFEDELPPPVDRSP